MDSSVVVVLVLLATVGLRVALVLAVVWLLIPKRAQCPRCSDTTLSLVSPSVIRTLRLERRWCFVCGWTGISKQVVRLADRRVDLPRVRDSESVRGKDRWKARWDDDDQWSAVEDDGWG